jgi:hypothetical protein
VQGVQELPDYSKVSFPQMQALALPLVLPAAHPEEVAFLSRLLVLDPSRRLGAEEALRAEYFQRAPLPAPAAALHVPLRVQGQKAQGGLGKPVASVEAFLREVIDNLVEGSV